jgi:hypothetical protein
MLCRPLISVVELHQSKLVSDSIPRVASELPTQDLTTSDRGKLDVGHWSISVPRSNFNRLSGIERTNVDPVRLLLLRISDSYALERLWITISVTDETMTRECLTRPKNQSIQESDTSLLLQLTLRPYWETETSVLRKA